MILTPASGPAGVEVLAECRNGLEAVADVPIDRTASDDELVEITPSKIRLRKKVLTEEGRNVGIGVCFEDAPLDPAAAAAVAALCRDMGYFGVFEAEFIRSQDRLLLIDFNPRYYNQMAFEIARGLPLPLLVHAAACGDEPLLRALALQAHAVRGADAQVYCHRFVLAMIVGAQRLSGRMGAGDARRWRTWYARNRRHAVDAAFDGEDLLPGLLATGRELSRAIRRPRAFFRSMVMNE